MSTGLKIGIVALLAVGVIGAGVAGAQVATAQRASAANAQASMLAMHSAMIQSGRGAMMGQFGGDQFGPGFQRGPMMGGQEYGWRDGNDQRGQRFQNGPMMGGYGWGDGPQGSFGPMMGGGWNAEYRDEMQAAMAEALGVTADELDAALAEGKSPVQIAQEQGVSAAEFHAKMTEAVAEVLKQAVADGKLTQAQVDAMVERMQQANTVRELYHGAMAEVLDMTVDELDAALAEGQSPIEIAGEKGISEEDFRAKLTEALTAALEQAVKDGTLTQDQADAILTHLESGRGPGMMWRQGPGWGGGPR